MKAFTKKSLSVILTILFVFSVTNVAYAVQESTTAPTTVATTETTTEEETIEETTISQEDAKKTLEEQRADLEEKQRQNEENLAKYSDEAKVCEEYIDALDEKIGYVNQELNILNQEVAQAKKNVATLEPEITTLSSEMKTLQDECDAAQRELDALNEKFDTTYNAYCLRLRAMYISGNTSIWLTLLTSKDLSQFYSRYEMIKAVSKSDTQLLNEINAEIDEITTKQNGLNEKNKELGEKKKILDAKQKEYSVELKKVETKQNQIAEKKLILADDRAESDALLAEYTEKTNMYTEYRNEDQELIDSVNNEIDALISGLKDPDEVTTATEVERTTSDKDKNNETNGALYARSNGVLNLTYPAPGHYSVSQTFGHYRNGKPHTGIDFPVPTGSRIVAAQKGIVITVKRLNYSYGYYVMVYHGTDASGRKVVTLYAHNSSLLVSVGQTVKKGQTIAKSGSTGNSTGPHCHFELIINGTKTNPKRYLSK